MAPLITLVVVFGILSLCARFGVRIFGDPVSRLRWALSAMFLLTASAHWGALRPDLVRMVPPAFPQPELLVTLTGIAELAGAIGLLIPRLAPWAGGCLALLLLAMFPANVHAAREGLSIGGTQVMGVLPRALLQLVFLAATLIAAFGHQLPRWRSRRPVAQ
jgi:uncharacterized membrane protein